MKLTMTRVLTPLAALAFTLGAQAKDVSTDDFESYAAGASMTNAAATAAGWSFWTTNGVPDESVVTTNAVDNKYLKLSTEDGVLFHNVDGTPATNAVQLLTGLYVDTDVQFTLTAKDDRPKVTEDEDKFIIWLEADEENASTNLCVWAREYKVENDAIVANANKVYKLNSGAIEPGSWHRLTVKAIQQTYTDGTPIPGFQVYLDGNLIGSGDMMFPDSTQNSAAYDKNVEPLKSLIGEGLKFFPAMANELETLKQVGFSGEGAIDNLVVTRDVPDFQDPTIVRFDFDTDVIASIDIDDLGASLTSTNDTIAVARETSFTFSINWKGGPSASGQYEIETSGDTYATVSDVYTVTAVSSGLAVITVDTKAKDTTDVTFTWEALGDVLEDPEEFAGISFTIGEDVYRPNDDELGAAAMTITGVKTGTNIVVTLSFNPSTKYLPVITPASCMTLDGTTLTLNSRPESGAATVIVSAEAAPSPFVIGGTGYDTLADALSHAGAGDTITFNADAIGSGAVSTAADAIDLNGHKLGAASITFTGSGAKTLKGGEVVDSYNVFSITNPANSALTLDGVTFHASVTPVGSGDVLLVTNCTFLCDKNTSGADATEGSTIHSYGILFNNTASAFTRADIVNNWFAQGRRAAVQASFAGDLYFYGNTVDATVNTVATADGLDARYPALQIFHNGRVFIENNTFFGEYLGEAFLLYNKGSNTNFTNAIVFNGNTVSNGVIHLGGVWCDTVGYVPADADICIGANDVGDQVDTTGVVYKKSTNGTGVSLTPASLALPTGVDTVYDWTHGANAGKMYVSGTGVTGFVNNLNDVAAGDTVIAVPGEVPVKANYTFTPGALKNQYTAALASYTITYMYGETTLSGLTPATYTVEDAPKLPVEVSLPVVGVSFEAWTNAEGAVVAGWSPGDKTGNLTFYAQVTAGTPPSGEELAPGEQSTATFETAEAATNALAGVTIAASAAVETALGDTSTYLSKFEKKVVESSGEYKIEIALTAAAETELEDEATTNVAVAVAAKLPDIAASATGSQTDISVTGVVPGFYYSISYGTAVNAITTEGPRALAGSSGSITLQTPAKASGATSGFYRVNVNVAPAPSSGE